MTDDFTRLNKFLAHALGLSRRAADQAIASGRVQVNRHIAELGAHIAPSDEVLFDGRPVTHTRNYTYIALHKPVGYLSSRKSQGGVPTIYELLPESLRRLKPVGRLDKESSGILLMTDDGDFAHRMTHPSFSKTKFYEVSLDQPLAPLHQQMISDHGIALEDGVSRFMIERLDQLPKGQTNRYVVTMREGRNRQIRRTFLALGYTVTRLHRTQFGPFSLSTLAPGKFQPVDLVA